MTFKGGGRPNNYLNTGGDKLPSVTTILGRFKDSGPLLHWAFGQGKAAERGEIRRLYDKRDEAAEIGTVAHDMAEAHIHKIDPMACLRDSGLVEDHAHTALQAFEMFERWEQIANVEWTHTEVPVVSERLQVGGTIDAVANVAGKLCIVDFKTSKGIYSDYFIQVAAYASMWEEMFHEPIQEIHILRFGKNRPDFEHQFRLDWRKELKAFELMVELYGLLKAIK